MRFSLFALLIFNFALCHADLSNHLKAGFGYAAKNNAIQNIDAIYLINLDKRPEKFARCIQQLEPYNIKPYRFSAICGWGLPIETLRDIGVKYQPGMLQGKWVFHYTSESGYYPESELLQNDFYGKPCVTPGLRPGAIGCALSHLSVLQNAYDCGYEAIWVLEDDISVQGDPHALSVYINKLDALIGKNGWDILYTDMDTMDHPIYKADNDFVSEMKENSFFWRPDMEITDQKQFNERTLLSEDFLKIGSRYRAHSLVLRRSGIKKILDFANTHHLFRPYDIEIPMVPNIKMVNLRHNLITERTITSDTQLNNFDSVSQWKKFKEHTLSQLANISGWKSPEVAEKLMDLIHTEKPKTCVEIGAFGGCISYPIAQSLQLQNYGTFYAIDAWDSKAALEGVQDQATQEWWNNLNLEGVYQNFQTLLKQTNLERYCHPIRKKSKDAVSLFADGSIDLLYIDGNDSSDGSLEDATLFLPKVRMGGYICLNAANQPAKSKAVEYLMKHCKWVKERSLGNQVAVFQKAQGPFAK